MKKILIVLALILTTGCATVFNGGPVTEYQKTKPAVGEPRRQIKVVPLVADALIFWPSIAVDFASGAIYKNK